MGRTKTKALQAPQTEAEAEFLLAAIGHNQIILNHATTLKNGELAEVEARHNEPIRAVEADIVRQLACLQAYGEANKDRICKGKARSKKLKTGRIGWRKGKVVVEVEDEETATAALLKAGYVGLVRTETKVNKTNLRDAYELHARGDKTFFRGFLAKLRGIKVERAAETFFADPKLPDKDPA